MHEHLTIEEDQTYDCIFDAPVEFGYNWHNFCRIQAAIEAKEAREAKFVEYNQRRQRAAIIEKETLR